VGGGLFPPGDFSHIGVFADFGVKAGVAVINREINGDEGQGDFVTDGTGSGAGGAPGDDLDLRGRGVLFIAQPIDWRCAIEAVDHGGQLLVFRDGVWINAVCDQRSEACRSGERGIEFCFGRHFMALGG